jgi:hypothetical protein
VPFILFAKSLYKSFKTHTSFFNYIYIYIYYSMLYLIVVAYLSSEAGDFSFAMPETIAKNTEFEASSLPR